VNSTLISASDDSLPRLHFHIISSNQVEANEVAQLLLLRFGVRMQGKLSAYGLAEMGDERLEGVKVWGGYRSEQLSKVSFVSEGASVDAESLPLGVGSHDDNSPLSLPATSFRTSYLTISIVSSTSTKTCWCRRISPRSGTSICKVILSLLLVSRCSAPRSL